MNRSLRTIVADDESEMLDYLVETLRHLSHNVVSAVCTGRELVEQCRLHEPELVITDIRMPDMDGLEAAAEIWRVRPTPIIIVSGHHEPDLIARAQMTHVVAYLVKPIKQVDLPPTINVAMRRFEELMILRKETENLRRTLDNRKLIERAKGILMRRAGLDEQAALLRLEQLADEQQRSVVAIAGDIVTADEAMQPPSEKSSLPRNRRRRRKRD